MFSIKPNSGYPRRSHLDGYRQEPPKPRPSPAHRRAGELVARKPRQEPPDGNAPLQPRHVEPGAHMRAGAEGEVAVGLAADVESIRVGELGRVAVGGADADGDEGAGGHGDAAELDGARGDAVAE